MDGAVRDPRSGRHRGHAGGPAPLPASARAARRPAAGLEPGERGERARSPAAPRRSRDPGRVARQRAAVPARRLAFGLAGGTRLRTAARRSDAEPGQAGQRRTGRLVRARPLYLAVDHPTDIVVSVVLGFSIPVLFFRLLVPNDAYPVVYALHRQTAHLDVTGARGEAIRRAAREQLGLLVVSVESFGLGGSAGSAPLRLRLDGESPTYVFAKLYAATTCEPTAGTNSVDPSSTARWRTRRRSRPCAASSSTRTTYCA